MIDMEEAGSEARREAPREKWSKRICTESDEMKQATGGGDKHAKRQQHGKRNGPLSLFVCSSCRGSSNTVIDRETLRQGPWPLGPLCL